jgi:ABC-type sugar transport system ATPase subunit
MIAGLEDINSGSISIGGTVVNDLPPKERNIAMVFQSYALYPHMTVFDNMAFGLKLEKRSKEEIDERVQEAAKILQIEDYLTRISVVLSKAAPSS